MRVSKLKEVENFCIEVESQESIHNHSAYANLPKYKPDGSKIEYKIQEIDEPNYDSEITGNAEDGFKIKNTNNL